MTEYNLALFQCKMMQCINRIGCNSKQCDVHGEADYVAKSSIWILIYQHFTVSIGTSTGWNKIKMCAILVFHWRCLTSFWWCSENVCLHLFCHLCMCVCALRTHLRLLLRNWQVQAIREIVLLLSWRYVSQSNFASFFCLTLSSPSVHNDMSEGS